LHAVTDSPNGQPEDELLAADEPPGDETADEPEAE
jgi:hypothetical protein